MRDDKWVQKVSKTEGSIEMCIIRCVRRILGASSREWRILEIALYYEQSSG